MTIIYSPQVPDQVVTPLVMMRIPTRAVCLSEKCTQGPKRPCRLIKRVTFFFSYEKQRRHDIGKKSETTLEKEQQKKMHVYLRRVNFAVCHVSCSFFVVVVSIPCCTLWQWYRFSSRIQFMFLFEFEIFTTNMEFCVLCAYIVTIHTSPSSSPISLFTFFIWNDNNVIRHMCCYLKSHA